MKKIILILTLLQTYAFAETHNEKQWRHEIIAEFKDQNTINKMPTGHKNALFFLSEEELIKARPNTLRANDDTYIELDNYMGRAATIHYKLIEGFLKLIIISFQDDFKGSKFKKTQKELNAIYPNMNNPPVDATSYIKEVNGFYIVHRLVKTEKKMKAEMVLMGYGGKK
jgi:hypothetical protein